MASQNPGRRAAHDLVRFAMDNKKWWLIPIVVVSVLVGAFMVIGYTPLAPFIYTVF